MRAALEGRGTPEIVERDDGFFEAIELPRDVYGTVSPLARTQPSGYALRPWPCARRRVRRRTGLPAPSGARPRRRGHRHLARRRRGVPPARRSSTPAYARIEDVGCDARHVRHHRHAEGTTSASSRARPRRDGSCADSTRSRPIAAGSSPRRATSYNTEDPDHLGYHERNRRRARMAGQIRMRVRHRKLKTPWFDYLMVSHEELEQAARRNRLASGANTRCRRHVHHRHREALAEAELAGYSVFVLLAHDPGEPAQRGISLLEHARGLPGIAAL